MICIAAAAAATAAAAAAAGRRGGELLLKLVNPDAAQPSVDLERPEVVEPLIRLLLGDQVTPGGKLTHP
jgi:hypothetical protein